MISCCTVGSYRKCGKIDNQNKRGERLMIYVTGDTHVRFDRIQEFCEEFNTSK